MALTVLPARAGMAQLADLGELAYESSPCTRRDGPKAAVRWDPYGEFSLHAQGWPCY